LNGSAVSFSKNQIDGKGGFCQERYKKDGSATAVFWGPGPVVLAVSVKLSAPSSICKQSRFSDPVANSFFNNMELAPSFFSELLVPKFSLDQLFQCGLL